jgi:hypothetical protein
LFGPFPCCYSFPFFLSRNHEWPAQPKILSQNKCACRPYRGGWWRWPFVARWTGTVCSHWTDRPVNRHRRRTHCRDFDSNIWFPPLTCCRYIIRFVVRDTRIPILIWSCFSLFFLICPWKEVSPVLRVPAGGQLHCCPTNSRKIILEYSNISRSLTAGSLVNFCLWYPSKLKSAPLFIATASPHRFCLLLLSFAFSFCA